MSEHDEYCAQHEREFLQRLANIVATVEWYKGLYECAHFIPELSTAELELYMALNAGMQLAWHGLDISALAAAAKRRAN